ncbi:hypothetical protein JCM16138_07750 [Thermococcus atlanticus]
MRYLALAVALLIISASLGYAYHEKRAEVDDAERGLMAISNTALFCLTDIGALETMLENNASEDVLRERVIRHAYCAEVLSEALFSLYDITGEEKYWKLHVASANLAGYFNHVRNSENPKELVAKNLNVLLKIDSEISGIHREWTAGNVTENMIWALVNLTEGLSW